MDLSTASKYRDLSVNEKVQLIMLQSSRPLHYVDVDELIVSIFGVKHSSYTHLKSSSEYIQLASAIYVHKEHATENFYNKLEIINNRILSYIEEIVEYAKIPVPIKCFAAHFSTTDFRTIFTNRSIRSFIAKILENHPFLYRAGGSAIASRNVQYDSNVIRYTAQKFSCNNCVLEHSIPLSDLVPHNCKPATPPVVELFSNDQLHNSKDFASAALSTVNRTIDKEKLIVTSTRIEQITRQPLTLVAVNEPLELSPLNTTKFEQNEMTVDSIIFRDQNSRLSKPLAEYDDLDEAMIDTYFIEVLNSSDPSEVIPVKLYEAWKNTVSDSPFASCHIAEVASEMDLAWPTTRQDEQISDFLKYGVKQIKDIVGFGRKKARTLILCVAYSAYKANKAKFTSYPKSDHLELTAAATFSEPTPQVTLNQLLQLERPEQEISSEQWEQWCVSIDNSLARTIRISEVALKYHLDWPYSKREDRVTEYLKQSLHRVKNSVGFGRKKLRTLVLCIAALALEPSTIDSEIISITASTDDSSTQNALSIDALEGTVREIINALPPREKLITKRRFGISDGKPLTLEEIANHTYLTRERVRQILKQVYERLKLTSFGKQLPILIEKLDTDELWGRLSNAYGVIGKSDISRAFERQFSGEFMFALECCGIDIPSWLSSIAVEHPSAWYRSSASPDEIRGLLRKLDTLFAFTKLPLPLAALSDYLQVSTPVLGTAICLFPDCRLFEGYIVRGRIASRARRTVHLHQLLVSEGSHLSLIELTARHNAQHPSESCSTRDADIVLREAQHLFASLGDQGWCSIGHYNADTEVLPEPADCKIEPETLVSADTSEDTSVTSILKTILRTHEFANFTLILDEFKRVPGNNLSEHSVGPILYTRNEFAKFAPSVYGLSEKLYGLANISSDLLLNDYDCQLYVMARYAGEEFYSYPLWSPSMEHLWCNWVQDNPNRELRESLYYIATPDEWPINDKLISSWKNLIAKDSEFYHLLRAPQYHGNALPEIRSLFSLIKYAVDTGSLSWISANRVLSRRIDDYHTAIEMAMLVCFGVLDPTCHNWQKRHNTKSEAEDICKHMSSLLPYDQDCSWEGQTGKYLLDIFTLNIATRDLGWVSVSEMNKLFHRAPSKSIQASIFDVNLNLTTEQDRGDTFHSISTPLADVIHSDSQQDDSLPLPSFHSSGDGSTEAYEDLLFLMDDDDTIILS